MKTTRDAGTNTNTQSAGDEAQCAKAEAKLWRDKHKNLSSRYDLLNEEHKCTQKQLQVDIITFNENLYS